MDKDAYYFPHFSNARQDRKLRRVRKELGVEGYGIYFMVLEVLRDQPNFSYPLDDIDLLADEFRTSEQKVRVVVCNYDLFEVTEDEFFYSPKFNEYLKPYLDKKQQRRISGIKGNLIKYGKATKKELEGLSDEEIIDLNEENKRIDESDRGAIAKRQQADRKSSQSKVKESKVNKTKEESVTTDADEVPNASDSETWQSATAIAEHLLESICEYDTTHRYNHNRPSLNSWVQDIDRALRLDGRTEEQMIFIINYIYKMNRKHSSFWAGNIESGAKLRKQFDKIKNQIKSEKTNGRTLEQYAGKFAESEKFLDQYYSESNG